MIILSLKGNQLPLILSKSINGFGNILYTIFDVITFYKIYNIFYFPIV